MAEKKNENEMNVTPEQVTKTEAPTNDSLILENDSLDLLGWMSDDYHSSVGSETVFRLKYDLQRKPTGNKNEDGSDRYNYAFGVSVDKGERKIILSLMLAPNPRNALGFQLLDSAFGDSNRCPVEVVKTVQTFNNETNVSYSLQVSFKDNDGAEIACALVPAIKGTGRILNNIFAVLKARGEIE